MDCGLASEELVEEVIGSTKADAAPTTRSDVATKAHRQPHSRPAATVPREQLQRNRNFSHRKQQIIDGLCLSGCDRSPKGFVDSKCMPIMEVLNAHPDYVTTSSCSGRTALFHSSNAFEAAAGQYGIKGDSGQEGKRGCGGAGWLHVTHDALTADDISHILSYFPESVGDGVAAPATSVLPPGSGIVTLKFEPYVMHVQCRTLDAAKLLLTAATDAGFRNSGVVPGNKIMVAIRHAGLPMEAPVAIDGAAIATRSHVGALLTLCARRLEENERRSALLLAKIKQRFHE